MSCVFLTDQHAWKLKKPVRYEFLDFSTPQARRFDCEEELRLNRRLASSVYLEVVPLVAAPDGRFLLGGEGEAVDWLVKMRRLPRRLMLDGAIGDASVTREDVRRFTLALSEFFRNAPPVAMTPEEYCGRFERGVDETFAQLSAGEYGLPQPLVRSSRTALLSALERTRSRLARQAGDGAIVEGHGDLRPEHICLEEPPVFIDCLEFNRDFRLLDPVDELAGLAMECEYAGAGWIGRLALDLYEERSSGRSAGDVVHFYQAYRAALRAKLCAWHLRDHPDPADQGKWTGRARRYLQLSEACARRIDLDQGPPAAAA
jgi:aminoglycoside phosphotransferase family enzyme